MFWDFQGADDPEELASPFSDALLDAEERLEDIGIASRRCRGRRPLPLAGKAAPRLRSQGRSLLLLCDEVEELINLNRQDPSCLRKLRRAMQSQDDIRSVLASIDPALCGCRSSGETPRRSSTVSAPPLYINGLSTMKASLADSPGPRRHRIAAGDRRRRRGEIRSALRQPSLSDPAGLQALLETGDLEEAAARSPPIP